MSRSEEWEMDLDWDNLIEVVNNKETLRGFTNKLLNKRGGPTSEFQLYLEARIRDTIAERIFIGHIPPLGPVEEREKRTEKASTGLLGGLLGKFIPGGGTLTDFLGENIEETMEETLRKLAPIAIGLGGWYVAETHASYTYTIYQKDAEGKDLEDAEGNKIPELDAEGNPVTKTIEPPKVLHLLTNILGLTATVLEVFIHTLSALIEKNPIDFLKKYQPGIDWSLLGIKKGGGW